MLSDVACHGLRRGNPQTAGNTRAGLTGRQSRPRLGLGERGNSSDAQPAVDIHATWSTVLLQRLCDFAPTSRRHLLARAGLHRTAEARVRAHWSVRRAEAAHSARNGSIRPADRSVMVAYATVSAIARFYTTVAMIRGHATERWHRSTLTAKETRSHMVASAADAGLVRNRQPGQPVGRAWSDARDRRLSRRSSMVHETAALSSVPRRGVAGIRQGAVFCQQRLPRRPRSFALNRCGSPAWPVLPCHFWDVKHER